MKSRSILLTVFFILLSASGAFAEQIVKELIRSEGKERAYYLFVPDKISTAKPVPLIVLLHGSGRTGISLVEKWKDLAKKEGIIIVGPDSLDTKGWRIPGDGPDFIHELVDSLKAKYPINMRRLYLFGHSAGAGQALYLSLLESEYFAATAIHAGALAGKDDDAFIEQAKRKIPIWIFVGTNDQFFPLSVVRATRDALIAGGFKCELTELKNHTHWYYDKASEINRGAWDFLKGYELTSEPKYAQHQFN